MNLPEFSVRRPTTIMMIVMALMIMGIVSLFRLPVELYPNASRGEISIIIYVRGQIPPVEVESQVTKLVEEAVSTVSHLKQILSITKEGESTVVLSFEPGTNMDFAALEVREKFAKIKNKLPKEIEKPVIAKFKQSDSAVMVFALTSKMRSPEEIRKIVDEWVKERFKRVTGVANVEVAGGRQRKILVELNQQKLMAYGITANEVTGTLDANNLNLLSGEVERSSDKLLIRLIGEFESIEQISNISIRRTEYNSVIRLKDIATVKDSYLEPREYSRLNVQDNVSIYVQKETTSNTIHVVDELQREMAIVEKDLPRDIRMVVTSNQATFIRKAINSLKESLLRGILLIFLVLFLFLFRMKMEYVIGVFVLILTAILAPPPVLLAVLCGLFMLIAIRKNLRPVVIVITPIPVAVLATFLFMRFGDLTLNVMTLFGLALGTGMLVDNSIVVFDNILKKREIGKDMRQASILGSQELLIAIVASTLTTVIVFLPMVFMSKEIQLLYSSMAITVVISLIISLFCAITLVPIISSKRAFASTMGQAKLEKTKDWAEQIYPYEKRLLFRMIRFSPLVLGVAALLFFVSVLAFRQIPKSFLGTTEQNKFTTFIEMPTGTKLDVSDDVVRRVEKIIEDIPELKLMTSRVEPWSSKIYVELVPVTARKRSVKEVIESIRPQVSKLDPAFVYFEEEEQVGTKEIIIEVFGFDYKLLRQIAIGIANRMETVKGLTDLKIRMREGRPEMRILIDKERSATMDVTTQGVADQVHAAMRGLRATLYHDEGKEVETITRLQEKFRKTFRDLYKMMISGSDGTPYLLEQVANFRFDLGPSEIWRKDRERMIQVSANLGKIPLTKAVEQVHSQLSDLEFPEDYYYRIGGDYDKLIQSQKEMLWVIVMVVVLVYLVLASLFESFAQPVLIMTAVPLALGGALLALNCGLLNLAILIVVYVGLALFLRSLVLPLGVIGIALFVGPVLSWIPWTSEIAKTINSFVFKGPQTVGVGAWLGMMMLSGIVVNNSIMLMHQVNFYTKVKKLSPLRSMILANRDRLRPILLTTSTTVLSLIPMAIDQGEGANLWSPLALTVIGGLLSSLVLTLAVMPAFYVSVFPAKKIVARHLQSFHQKALTQIHHLTKK